MSQFVGFAQEKGDLSVILSSNRTSQYSLEYRTTQKNKYLWRFAYQYGEQYWSNGDYRPEWIISASDSLIVFRLGGSKRLNHSIRFGLERQFGNSIFSMATDVIIGFQLRTSYAYNSPYILLGTDWKHAQFISSEEENSDDNPDTHSFYPTVIGDPNLYYERQHFFAPGIRFGANMDLPIGSALVFHAGIYSSFTAPIYMGRTTFVDNPGTHYGTPSANLNFDLNAEVGIRYNIGSIKNREKRKKG